MGDVIEFRRTTDAVEQSVQRAPGTPVPAPARSRDDESWRAPEPLWRQLAGHELRTARQRRRETLARVAARAGISVQYLSEIERGRKEPSSEVLAAVTGALQLTLLDLTSAVSRGLGAPRHLGTSRGHGAGPARGSDPVALAA
jgi:DNA-binding XRE family transcriptional regulator